MVTLRQFLVDVVGQDKGFICLATKERPDGKWDERHFAWPEAIDEVTSAVRQTVKREYLDLYFCAQLLSVGKRQKSYVKSCSSLWAEMDGGCKPEDLLIKPTYVIESSPNKYHVYWVLNSPATPQEAESLTKRIAYHHEGIDKSGWDLTQVLRIPGTKNWKYSPPEDVTLLDHQDVRYSLNDFDVYPEVEAASPTSSLPIPSLAELEELGTAEQILYTYRTADEAAEIDDLRTSSSEDRSKALFKLIRLTAEAGMTRAQSFLVITGTANDKWCQAPHSNPDLLWNDIDRVNKRSEIVKLGPGAFFDKTSPQYRKMADYIVTHTPLALGDDGFVYGYEKGVYKQNRDAIGEALIELLQNKYKSAHVASVQQIATKMLKDRDQHIDLAIPGKVVVSNGILDLRTLVLAPHSPSHLATSKLPITWDPAAQCTRYLSWANSVGIMEYLPILEEYIALALDSSRDKHHAVMLIGPSHSGKSTFIRFVQAVIGRENYSSASLHDLGKDKFTPAQLYGKLLNTSGDISSADIQDITKFLGMVGGDTIIAQHKYGQQFQMHNRALMIFSTNSPPAVPSAHAKAYRNRMMPFWFSRTFEGHENPAWERMVMAEELPGIFRRLVEAYQRTAERGHLPEVPSAFKEEFAGQSDRVLQWVNEVCARIPQGVALTKMPTPEQGTPGLDLLNAFNWWATDNRFNEMGRNTFYQALEANGIRMFSPNRMAHVKWFRLYLQPSDPHPDYTGSSIVVHPNGHERKS